MIRRRPAGIAVVVVLAGLAVAGIFVVSLGFLSLAHLRSVDSERYGKVSLYAAEAGAATALGELRADAAWSAGFSDVAYGSPDSRYWVEVANNFAGTAPITAADGTSVPAGRCYLRATGRCFSDRYPRGAALMLEGAAPSFPYALASGGTANLQASGDIHGSIRTNGDLILNARTEVFPLNGEGRVLAGGAIDNKNLVMDSAQDVRAAATISAPELISGTTNIFPGDTSADTEPMVADGRLTNDGLPVTMPNPDLSVLLAPGTYVDHTGTTSYGNKTTLALEGRVHYFPDGVTFANGSDIVGPGMIVSGGGAVRFLAPLRGDVFDVVALDGAGGLAGTAIVEFGSSADLSGLVYSQGDILLQARMELDGRLIAYGSGTIQARSGANLEFRQVSNPVPGFEAFFGGGSSGGGGSSAGISVSSWQRVLPR